jgi:hypothetical protein
MIACKHGLRSAAGIAGCQLVSAHQEVSKACRAVPPMKSTGRGIRRHREHPSLSRLSPHFNSRNSASSRVNCAADAEGPVAPKATGYDKMLEDLEEKNRERTGTYKHNPQIEPMSMEEAKDFLALDRPDLSIPVEDPIEWRVGRRESTSTSRFTEITDEQMANESEPLKGRSSNAGKFRSVEERCNLKVRRNVSQVSLLA